MTKITHPCAVTAQPGKGEVLLLTSKYNKKKRVLKIYVLTKHKSDKADDVLNHLKCKHTH